LKSSFEDVDTFGDVPIARFGHTITPISKTMNVMFGGATGDTGKYSMTGDTFVLNLTNNSWTRLTGKLD
jgi:hypothetical protein